MHVIIDILNENILGFLCVSTSITEEVISFPLVHHNPQHIHFVDWMLVIKINS